MAKYITITDLATKSRKIFERVGEGETLIVLRHHRPIAAIVPIDKIDEDLSCWDLQLEERKGEKDA